MRDNVLTNATLQVGSISQSPAAMHPIDLSRSIPPMPPLFTPMLQRTLARLAARDDIGVLSRNSLAGGTAVDRAAARLWLRSRLQEPPDNRLIVTNGTQGALLLLFEALVGQGGLLAAEALSYGVLPQLAARAHIRVCSLDLDADGIEPSSFELTCKTHRPRALYCNPTVHNPTAIMMPAERRKTIAEIARRHAVTIIEDEPLGCLHPEAPPPMAMIAPDITWYIAGLTKGLAHGFRVAYVVGPTAVETQAVATGANRLSYWFPSPVSTAIVNDWIVSGVADRVRNAISAEAACRQQLAEEILGDHGLATQPGGLHAWLSLPPGIDRRTFAQELARDRVLVRPSDAFAIEPERNHANAIRISLSGPLDREEVERGLRIIASALECRA